MACHVFGCLCGAFLDVACHMFVLGVNCVRAHPFFVACHGGCGGRGCVRTRFLSVACHRGGLCNIFSSMGLRCLVGAALRMPGCGRCVF